jgi:hypothetical protein
MVRRMGGRNDIDSFGRRTADCYSIPLVSERCWVSSSLQISATGPHMEGNRYAHSMTKYITTVLEECRGRSSPKKILEL